jgi:hypothetical protein
MARRNVRAERVLMDPFMVRSLSSRFAAVVPSQWHKNIQ